MLSSTKPEVAYYNVSQRRRRKTEGHMQHAQKFGKDSACGSGDILADRQTDRHTQRHTHKRTHHNTSHPSRAK